jgi:hypothetical protein
MKRTRFAMWSGPRNISTAMMRSWGARADCTVSDEPMYAHYLNSLSAAKRNEHPAWGEVIRSQPTSWVQISRHLTGHIPGGKTVWYQKHMAHHLTEDSDRDWVFELTNCFLIRDPASMIQSFSKVIENPTPEDLGLPQQLKLFDKIKKQTGGVPPVIDSRDVLEDPEEMLGSLCQRIGIPFDVSMLSWEPGIRKEDGVWAPHWYSSVYESTGFAPYVAKEAIVPDHLLGVLDECQGIYDQLAEHRIRPISNGSRETV